ncbi:hypothetical protein IFT48_13400 [Pseudomonas fluorescens]|uniref:Uncharacterized protein n=1 Tax=Pseudomonas edaphica TaxID=2006980 RepID=A0A7Y8E361_9PSED|nr:MULTISPECIES: hypothetical protein [Pseudomonas]MBD8090992.1 hypothetical protein [Pseudomonas fluorescens]MBD8717476.1 hypothetical protein [Pseudomonas fluorescens]NWC48742.1 hypothetical protein [Pseudomonas sp. IPO3747]NWE07160.1 hypothetical protein [Pseudomonas edaphica]NWE81490.1 hypothetical protein [Pseudomonas edaphica]
MSNIDFGKMKTAEQLLIEAKQAELDSLLKARKAAYVSESDPLRLEADYDAMSHGLEPDYAKWFASVAAIKARFPLPAGDDTTES